MVDPLGEGEKRAVRSGFISIATNTGVVDLTPAD